MKKVFLVVSMLAISLAFSGGIVGSSASVPSDAPENAAVGDRSLERQPSRDSMGAYLGWKVKTNTLCTKRWTKYVGKRRIRGGTRWIYLKTTTSASGQHKTDYYYRDGFRKVRVHKTCIMENPPPIPLIKGGHVWRTYAPIRYRHKHQWVNFNCHSLGCALMFKKTSDWHRGTYMHAHRSIPQTSSKVSRED